MGDGGAGEARRASRWVTSAGIIGALLAAVAVASVPVDKHLLFSGQDVIRPWMTDGVELGAVVVGLLGLLGAARGRRSRRRTVSVGSVLCGLAVVGAPVGLAVVRPHDSPPTVLAVELATGQVRWQAKPPVASVYSFRASDSGDVVLEGARTRSRCDFQDLDVTYSATGRRLRTAPHVPDAPASAPVVSQPDGLSARVDDPPLALQLGNRDPGPTTGSSRFDLVATSTTTGRIAWTVPTDASVEVTTAKTTHGELVVLTLPWDAGFAMPGPSNDAKDLPLGKAPLPGAPTSAITVLDPRTGKTVWSEPSDGKAVSTLALTDQVAYLFRGSAFVGRDLATGTVLLDRPVPAADRDRTFLTVVGSDRALYADTRAHTLTLYEGAATAQWTVLWRAPAVNAAGVAGSLFLISGGGKSAYTCGGE